MKKNKKKKGDKYSTRLILDEIRQYEAIGDIDYSQDFLEMISDRMIQDLIKIKDSKVSDNQAKADAIGEYLGTYGFVELDLGTNIYVMAHHRYPGVVFKIALDDCGVADNFNDNWLQDYIPNLVPVLALHPSGMISVQERKVILKKRFRTSMFMPEILEMLRELSKRFVLVDVSPKSMRNFYIDRDGTIGLADASDLFLIPENYDIFRCENIVGVKQNGKTIKCHGKLKYDDIYYELVCQKCGKHYNPWSLRRSKKEEIGMCLISPGLTAQEWAEVNAEGRLIRKICKTLDQSLSVNEMLKIAREKIEKMKSERGTVVIRGDEVIGEDSKEDEDPAPDTSSETTVPESEWRAVPVEEMEKVVSADIDVGYSDGSVSHFDVGAEAANRLKFSIMMDGDCFVETRGEDATDRSIYLTVKSKDFIEVLKAAGPSVYLSIDGGESYTLVVTPEILANLIEFQTSRMEEEGTWSID